MVSYNEKCTNKQLPLAEQISTDMRTARDTPLKTFRTDTVVNESKVLVGRGFEGNFRLPALLFRR